MKSLQTEIGDKIKQLKSLSKDQFKKERQELLDIARKFSKEGIYEVDATTHDLIYGIHSKEISQIADTFPDNPSEELFTMAIIDHYSKYKRN